MAQYPGQYQIGNNTFDIDPAWTNVLYGPLNMQNFTDGFQFNTQVPSMPYQPAPTETPVPVETPSYTGKDSGGDGESRARGIDPNSGMAINPDINFDNSAWWGGLYNPNVSTVDALKQYAPIMGQFHMNPLGTVLKSMKLDPMNDKLLQEQLGNYLSEVNSTKTLEDIMAAYKELVANNTSANLNREDTIQGLAYAAHPTYEESAKQAIAAGWEMNDLGKWSQGVAQYNATNPNVPIDMAMTVDPRTIGWANPVLSPTAQLLNTYRTFNGLGDTVSKVNDDYDPLGLTNKVTDIVQDYGYKSWDEFAKGVKGGYDSRETGENGGNGSGGYDGSSSGTTNASTGSQMGGGWGGLGGFDGSGSIGNTGGYDGKGGRSDDSGGGDGPSGGGSSSGSGSDGDSSNDGNGQHE